VATTRGNRAVSSRNYSAGHNPLKANTRVRIPLEPPTTIHLALWRSGLCDSLSVHRLAYSVKTVSLPFTIVKNRDYVFTEYGRR
jgi:hypothetical protein